MSNNADNPFQNNDSEDEFDGIEFTDPDALPEGSEVADAEQADGEVDPAVLAQLDQEAAEFNEFKADFEELYGFKHDCRCAADYQENKIVPVTECYIGMTDDALDTCARLNFENKTMAAMLQSMIDLNNELIEQLEDNGSLPDGEEDEDGDESG